MGAGAEPGSLLDSPSLGGVCICLPAAGTHFFWLFSLLHLKMVVKASYLPTNDQSKTFPLLYPASFKMLQGGLSFWTRIARDVNK